MEKTISSSDNRQIVLNSSHCLVFTIWSLQLLLKPLSIYLSQKKVEDTAPGILSGIVKGFEAGKVEYKVDLPEISNSTCAHLDHIFSYPPFLKPYMDVEDDPLFLKPYTVAVKDYQEVVELNIDKRLEKERLFEGPLKTRTVGARITKRKRK